MLEKSDNSGTIHNYYTVHTKYNYTQTITGIHVDKLYNIHVHTMQTKTK